MKRFLLIYLCAALLLPCAAFAQNYSISGRVTDRQTSEPVEFATVMIEGTGQWAVADAKGNFTIKNVPAGKVTISVACLGYVTDTKEVNLSKDIPVYQISLNQDNLSLDGAVVTAKENDNAATTSRTIDRTALDHVQVMNVADITSLLPGGVTTNPSLVAEQVFNLRAGSAEDGNATFGTAVEVDGVRLSNNASFAGADASTGTNLKGVSTNNVASSNVESVEVITGVPSVEYGDMTSGVVKINTKKGKTPWTVTMSTNPSTKQTSLSKGFGLGSNRKGSSRGVLNASAEWANSVSEPMSPYTSYTRRQLSMIYSNTFTGGIFANTPLRFTAGVTGNLGGYDSSADPDAMKGTFTINSDNTIRGNFTADWLLSKSWITNVELKGSIAYSDKLIRECKNYSGVGSTAVLHGKEEGYYMAESYVEGAPAVLLPPARSWYNVMACDDRPLNSKLSLKADWSRNFGKVNSKLKIGGEWSADKNFGIGDYSEDESTAPTYRTYRYCDIPAMNNIAAYAEENLMIPVGKDGRINLIAGIRDDNTVIKGSAYGTTSSFSPRFNAKYTVFTEKGRRSNFVKELSFRASWGEAVKLPSFAILYPAPSYYDINVFTSTSGTDNKVNRAFYIMPRTLVYNPSLKWQHSRQAELGFDINLDGTKISLAGYYGRTLDSYMLFSDYERFTYVNTSAASVQGNAIPVDDRVYTIDRTTGVVTMADATGKLPSQTVESGTIRQIVNSTYEGNLESPITRCGLEWTVDFKRIKAINTTIRFDGSYYQYRSLNTNTIANSPYSQTGSDRQPFSLIGYYYGADAYTNGHETRTLTSNLTITTHIPKVRMIFSAKLEASLYRYSMNLCERADGSSRGYILSDKNDMSSIVDGDFYGTDNYVVVFPDAYATYDDPTPQPFVEKFLWAKKNDQNLYNDMCKLAKQTYYNYIFKPDVMSPFFNVNLSVTKEIKDFASISFYANNFYNSRAQYHSSRNDEYHSVTTLGYYPKFYYGLTLRLKF